MGGQRETLLPMYAPFNDLILSSAYFTFEENNYFFNF